MKLWLSILIVCALIVALLRYHYAEDDKTSQNETPVTSLARQGINQMGLISKDPESLNKAVSSFTAALKSDASDPLALFGLGWALQTQGNNQEAERLYQQAVIQNNEICKYTHFNLSLLRESAGDIASALREIQIAKFCDPTYAPLAIREAKLKEKILNSIPVLVPGQK